MKRKDLYDLQKGINACMPLSNPNDYEFAYKLVCNIELVDGAIAGFEKLRPPLSEEYTKYAEEQTNLLNKYALKKPDGSLIVYENSVALADPNKYNEDLAPIKVKYKLAIDAQEKLQKKFDDFLDKEANIKLEIIPKKYLPKNISGNQLKGIFKLIEKTDK